MPANYDTHSLSLVDIPRVIRLAGDGMTLDAELAYTSSRIGPNSSLITSMMPHTSHHTLVARYGNQYAIGQYYLHTDDHNARLSYLAPRLGAGEEDSAWLLVLDAMVREAGRRGAHTLTAELDENSPLFITMRQSGFAVYARQQIWVYEGDGTPLTENGSVEVEEAVPDDLQNIMGLYARTVPSLLQQVCAPPNDSGYLYRENAHTMGYICVTEGRQSVFLKPYLDPQIMPKARAVIAAVVDKIPRTSKRKIVVRVRRHQGWLGSILESMGFECISRQAVMVRHIAAGIHSPAFEPLNRQLVSGTNPRRIERVSEVIINADVLRQMEKLNDSDWTRLADRVAYDGVSHTRQERHALRPNGGLPGL